MGPEEDKSPGFRTLVAGVTGGSYVSGDTLWFMLIADTLQREVYQGHIVREKLVMLLDAATKDTAPDKDIILQWLRDYTDVVSRESSLGRRTANAPGFTRHGVDGEKSIDHLAHLLNMALNSGHDEKVWNEHDASLSLLLEKRIHQITKIPDTEPAFQSTLHLLYTSYELAKCVTDIIEYICKLPSYANMRSRLSKEADRVSKRLLKDVVAKSSAIKKALEESGWMDRVLESIGQDPTEQAATVDDFLDVVGEGFREDWAGKVLESWKDSVVGFSLFKNTPS